MAINPNLGRRGFLALAAVSVAAQTTSSPGGSPPQTVVRSGQMGGMMMTNSAWFSGPNVIPAAGAPGQPYSAEQITEHIQTLADGTHITQAGQKSMLYRDSAGRTRTEHTFQPPPGMAMAAVMPPMVQIMDPVAGYHYTLNAQNHSAQRMPFLNKVRQTNGAASGAISFSPSAASASGANTTSAKVQAANGAIFAPTMSPTPSDRPHPQIQKESLGTDTIEGLTAEGMRTTVTYPEGTVGNDRPITTVTEVWMSPELKMPVLSKMSDPRNGDSTTKLINISLTEPDPSLFQIPADYQIIDPQQ